MKGIIFDWGGVIMHTQDYSHRHAWDDRLGAEPETVERIVHGIEEWNHLQHGTITEDEYRAAVSRHLGINLEDTAQLLADFYRGDRLNKDALTLIEWLNTRDDVRIGLMSNNTLALRNKIDELGLTTQFQAIVVSAEIGVMKPHRKAYLAAVSALDLAPERCLFIDDTPLNVDGAEAAGLHALHFTPETDLSDRIKGWLSA